MRVFQVAKFCFRLLYEVVDEKILVVVVSVRKRENSVVYDVIGHRING